MPVQEPQHRLEGPGESLLALGQLWKDLEEDQGNRHSTAERQPAAAGNPIKEGQSRGENVDQGQAGNGEQRGG